MELAKFKEAMVLLEKLEVNEEDFKKLNLLKNDKVGFIHIGYKDYKETLLLRNANVQITVLEFIETKLAEEKASIETEFANL